jgi:hypothetical protein
MFELETSINTESIVLLAIALAAVAAVVIVAVKLSKA